jgi:hypothetical protein
MTSASDAKTAGAGPSDAQIDEIIRRNLQRFAKPGVTSVRPGRRITKGMLSRQPAIVVSVRKKIRNLPPDEMLPSQVEGVPIDVRPVSPVEALRATDPEAFAQMLTDVPRGNVPIELQTANFPLERNLKGELIPPLVDKAVARVRPRRPGEPRAGLTKATYQKLPSDTFKAVIDEFTVTCFASPDAGWPTLEPFLRAVNNSLTVGMFEFTAPHIVQALSEQMAGKTLNLLLDDPDYDTTMRDQDDDATHDQPAAALGDSLNFAWAAEGADKHNSIHLFPGAYHIKVAVADAKSFFLSSGNFNTTNQPAFDPINAPGPGDAHTARTSDRDWHVIVEHAGLAKTFEDLILRDLQQASPGQRDAPPVLLKGTGNALGAPYTTFFPPKSFSGRMTIQPALTPDNYVDVILPLIRSARVSLWMQTQYIKPSSKFAHDVQDLPVNQRSILEQLIDALHVLFQKRVDMRIIVDSRVTSSMIENLQMFRGLDGSRIRVQDHVHNKGMIIDGNAVVIGSQNWSTEGVHSNRDASVVITNPEMAASPTFVNATRGCASWTDRDEAGCSKGSVRNGAVETEATRWKKSSSSLN